MATYNKNTADLNIIDYGSMLSNDLMSELAILLADAGIDITKYASLINP